MYRQGSIVLLAAGVIVGGGMNAMAIEEAKYKVVEKEEPFEIRDYAPHILAEVTVDAGLENAGNRAFGILFRYISGSNRSKASIAMTAPVAQERRSEKIAMTAPVGQQRSEGGWAVSFMMPASFTLESAPAPEDPRITLRQVPARRVAAVRYRGTWREDGFRRHKEMLESWIQGRGLEIAGEPVWARYNPPITPWFLRRNEILIPVRADTGRP